MAFLLYSPAMGIFSRTNLHDGVKLGKRAARKDPRTLQFANYSASMPATPRVSWHPAPQVAGYSQRIANLGMLMNDALGDCTCAGAAHMVQAWLQLNGTPYIPLDEQVEALYEAVGGYVPGNPSTDNGAVLLDVLRYWKANGILPIPTLVKTVSVESRFSATAGDLGKGGGPVPRAMAHDLTAFAEVQPTQHEEVRRAIYYFGGAYIGLQLPNSAQSQDVWDVPMLGPRFNGAPGSWGGHCVNLIDYTDKGVICITWGALKMMTWKFFDTYCDEAYALLSPDWLRKGICPAGFAMDALQEDLAAIAEA